jgi:HlyD family secretion protein
MHEVRPKRRWTARLIVGLLAVALAAVALAMRPGAAVQVVRPRLERLAAYVEEQAVTELPRDTLISMPIGGWLEPITLREGDAVQAGQVVARLETADLQDRVKQAEQRIAVLETDIRSTEDHRLELHMLEETRGVVQAFEETVRAAEAQLEGSLAIFEFARSEVERIQKLSESDAAAERELSEARKELRKSAADYRSDVLQLAAQKTMAAISQLGPKFMTDYIDRKSFELESLRRQLAEAQAQLEIERRNRARAEITSPVDGLVLNCMQTRRQYLAAGTPLLTIGRLEDLEVIAEVLTERAMSIEAGDPVEVVGMGLPQGPVMGRVLRVYPAGFMKISSLGVEQQRVKVAIKLDERPARLGVGFRLDVRIVYDVVDQALTVPRFSLFRDAQGRWQAFVVRGGRVAVQPVELGLANDDRAQIISGLNSADLVVIHPSREIEPGMRVQAAE